MNRVDLNFYHEMSKYLINIFNVSTKVIVLLIDILLKISVNVSFICRYCTCNLDIILYHAPPSF